MEIKGNLEKISSYFNKIVLNLWRYFKEMLKNIFYKNILKKSWTFLIKFMWSTVNFAEFSGKNLTNILIQICVNYEKMYGKLQWSKNISRKIWKQFYKPYCSAWPKQRNSKFFLIELVGVWELCWVNTSCYQVKTM